MYTTAGRRAPVLLVLPFVSFLFLSSSVPPSRLSLYSMSPYRWLPNTTHSIFPPTSTIFIHFLHSFHCFFYLPQIPIFLPHSPNSSTPNLKSLFFLSKNLGTSRCFLAFPLTFSLFQHSKLSFAPSIAIVPHHFLSLQVHVN